jgi:hypothetical protein
MNRLLVLLFAFFLAACTNDPEPAPKDLDLSASQADSVYTQIVPFVYDLKVESENKPLADAEISLQIDAAAKKAIGKTGADGSLHYSTTGFSSVIGQYVKLVFTATKPGHETSTLTKFLRFDQALTITIADTFTAEPGQALTIPISVGAGAIATPDITVNVLDHSTNNTISLTASNGSTGFVYLVPTSGPRLLRFTATASKTGYIAATKDFYVRRNVIPRKLEGFGMTSLNSTSIGLVWDPVEGYSEPYVVNVYTGGEKIKTLSVTTTETAITGLEPNRLYSFGVEVDGEEKSYGQWATAKRLPFEANGTQTVRLWETAAENTTRHSGLILSADGMSTAATTSNESSKINMVLATQFSAQAPVSLVSPGVIGSGLPFGKSTTFSEVSYYVIGGLDKDYYTGSIASLFSMGYNELILDQRDEPRTDVALVLPVLLTDKDNDVNYARLEVLMQPNGQPFGFDNGNAFIDLRASYQTMTNVGYAGRPRSRRFEAQNKPVHPRQ